MTPAPVRLYRPTGPDHVAVVSTAPAPGHAGEHYVQVARGHGAGQLKQGTVFGPYPAAELEARFADVLATLGAEGFGPSGQHALFADLHATASKARARAALKLGWRKVADAGPALLARLPNAVDDACSILDALGLLGDPQAIPAVRPYAERK